MNTSDCPCRLEGCMALLIINLDKFIGDAQVAAFDVGNAAQLRGLVEACSAASCMMVVRQWMRFSSIG
jgi:hypothetical protein